MSRKPHSTSLVLLLIGIFAFWWGVSVLSQSGSSSAGKLSSTAQNNPAAGAAPLVVTETDSGGVYTFSGSYVLADQCDSLGSGIHYSMANGGHLSVSLVTSPATTACAQAAGDAGQPFSVSIKLTNGSTPIFDGVTVNGQSIPVQLVQGS